MRLEMLYKDQNSGGNGCPAVYLAENGQIVIQGPEVDQETFTELVNVLPGEIAVQIAPEVLLGAVERLRAKNGVG